MKERRARGGRGGGGVECFNGARWERTVGRNLESHGPEHPDRPLSSRPLNDPPSFVGLRLRPLFVPHLPALSWVRSLVRLMRATSFMEGLVSAAGTHQREL